MELTTLGDIAGCVSGRISRPTPSPNMPQPGGERTSASASSTPDAAVVAGPDVVIDSRLATRGCLFVALPGERVDGHDFTDAAAAKGAVAALVTRPTVADLVHIEVADAAQALADLAREQTARLKPGLKVVGITGSAGKTSTKDLLAQVLETAGPTVSPQGSFNNEIGVPLTALQANGDTRFLVSEMGARGQGHIASLCHLVSPDIGVVVNVGSAHLGEFGTVASIVRAKGELIEALPKDGWAVLNADDELVASMVGRAKGRVAWFSTHGRPTQDGAVRVWATDIESGPVEQYSFVLNTDRGVESAPVHLQVTGGHMVSNALAAAAAALTLDLGLKEVAAALTAATTRSRWRMEVRRRSDGVIVVNDAYNANPDSMRVAITTAANLVRQARATHPRAQLFAVLGDMLELGEDAPSHHLTAGRHAADCGAGLVLAVGEFAGEIVSGAQAGGADAVHLDSRDEAIGYLAGLRPGDVVLVKASRGVGLETVAERVLGEPC